MQWPLIYSYVSSFVFNLPSHNYPRRAIELNCYFEPQPPAWLQIQPGAASEKTAALKPLPLLALRAAPSLPSLLFWLYLWGCILPSLHRQGQRCTLAGKSWCERESSLGQPLWITPPCLMYMKQNTCCRCVWVCGWRGLGGSESVRLRKRHIWLCL